VAPLRPAEDAVVIDSTGLSVSQVVDRVLELVVSRI
jgi:cytidylate kinase